MSSEAPILQHWRRSVDDGGIGWLTLDKADSTANTLSAAVLEGLGRELDALEGVPLPTSTHWLPIRHASH